MARDIVVLAGIAPHSVLSLCKMAKAHKVHAFVVCIDDGFDSFKKSRIIDESFIVKKEDLCSFWEGFIDSHHFELPPILYPTTDVACLLVNDNRIFYERFFVICMPSHDIVAAFNDKTLAEDVALKNGLCVPKTLIANEINDMLRVSQELHFPVIVKPKGISFQHEVGFKFDILQSPEELESLKEIVNKGAQLVIQEYIPGGDEQYSFYLFYRSRNGVVHDCIGVKSLQRTGIMAIGTVKRDERLAAICRDFLAQIDYYGIGGIEFKQYDGKYYFIEMSTRTEGFLPIAQMAGSSLVDASYLEYENGDSPVVAAEDGVVYIDTFFWMLKRFQESNILLFLKELIRYSFSCKAHFAGLYLDKKFSLVRYWKMIFKRKV